VTIDRIDDLDKFSGRLFLLFHLTSLVLIDPLHVDQPLGFYWHAWSNGNVHRTTYSSMPPSRPFSYGYIYYHCHHRDVVPFRPSPNQQFRPCPSRDQWPTTAKIL
jgi:hypothetical protein